MGKNLIQQKRGKGSPSYKAPSFRYEGKIGYPSIEKKVINGKILDLLHCSGHSAPLTKIEYGWRCKCGNKNTYNRFNPLAIIEVDTILISSRHLYRMPYSLNEKSSKVSVPINPDEVLSFQKKMAEPKDLKIPPYKFLDKSNVKHGEAKDLVEKAFEFSAIKEKESEGKPQKEFRALEEAIPESFFPPCIMNILNGLEDGRKRSLFILTNFLTSVGWSYDMIEKLLKAWNEKKPGKLREVLIQGQLRYHKQRKKMILPPNCQNKMYYEDMRICTPDNLCAKIKNPVNYSIVKTKYLNKDNKKKTPKKKISKESKNTGKWEFYPLTFFIKNNQFLLLDNSKLYKGISISSLSRKHIIGNDM